MKFTVVWHPEAESQLADIYLAASSKSLVSDAANLLDFDLRTSPLNLGESRSSAGLRIAHEIPLGIKFEVLTDDRVVRVLSVWSCCRET